VKKVFKNIDIGFKIIIAVGLNSLNIYVFAPVFSLFVSERRVPSLYAIAGCERKDIYFYVNKFFPSNFFDSFAPLGIIIAGVGNTASESSLVSGSALKTPFSKVTEVTAQRMYCSFRVFAPIFHF